MPNEQPEQPDGSQQENEKSRKDLKEKEGQSKRSYNIWKRWKDGEESDWWFASTGIPLLAATLGPLANVSSIAALVTPWRQTNIINGEKISDFNGVPFSDPKW
jgi:potassium channel subfamily K